MDSKFDLALDLIEEVETGHSMNDVIYLQAQNLRGEIYFKKNDYNKALKYLELEQLNSNNNIYLSIDNILLRTRIMNHYQKSDELTGLIQQFDELIDDVRLPLIKNDYQSEQLKLEGITKLEKGDFLSAIEKLEKSVELGILSADKKESLRTLTLLSHAYGRLNRFEEAIELLYDALDFVNEESLEKSTYNFIMTNLGSLYQQKGNLIRAEGIFLDLIPYFESMAQPGMASGLYKNLAELFYQFGQIHKAIEFTNKSIESFKLIDHQAGIMASKMLLAKIRYISNEIDSAISILDHIFALREAYHSSVLIFEVILFRVLIFCRTDSKLPIDDYITYFNESKQNPLSQSSEVVIELIDAILSLSQSGIRSKALALEKLEWIASKKNVNFEFKNYSIRFIIEILLIEYKENLSHEIFGEIIHHLSLLEEMSKRENMYPTLIETMIIKSKFLVIQGKFRESNSLLEEALKLAERYNLITPKNQIIEEKSRLVDEFQRLKSFVDINYALIDEIEKQEFNEYLDTIRQFRVQLDA